jgi:hypothetical protein
MLSCGHANVTGQAIHKVDDPRDSRRDGPPGQGQVLRFRNVAALPDAAKTAPIDVDASRSGVESSSLERSSSELFGIVWDALADILGTAAVATLMRRAAQKAALRWPELGELSVTLESLEYRYALPASWSDRARPPHALRELVGELWTLLVDLTGPVVVNRLLRIPELREHGILPERGENS